MNLEPLEDQIRPAPSGPAFSGEPLPRRSSSQVDDVAADEASAANCTTAFMAFSSSVTACVTALPCRPAPRG